jgi:hypothetical protein
VRPLFKIILSIACLLTSAFSGAACLDGLNTTTAIVSKVRGFSINSDNDSGETVHYVVIDKASCTASNSGDVTLQALTKNSYYLAFSGEDKALYSMLLSAEARGVVLKFRLSPSSILGSANKIAYVLSPHNVNSQ